MMLRSRTAQTTILAAGSALAFMTAAVGNHAHVEGKLDASYRISFTRIPVGEITATVIFGDSEYAISARACRGVIKYYRTAKVPSPLASVTVATNFTSKIVSNTETSNVTMLSSSVKEHPPPPTPSPSPPPFPLFPRTFHHQRYDLKLAFKRMDKVTAEKGYAGPVAVCSVSYEPIAGHASIPLVKYLSEGREMEMALAPIAGTRLLAPFGYRW